MKTLVLGITLIAAAPAAHAMNAAEFLQKAEALKARGAMAMFSGDLKLLTAEMKTAGTQLRAERLAAQKAGGRPAYCPKTESGRMNADQVIAIMRNVPGSERARTSVKDALRAHFVRTLPCA